MQTTEPQPAPTISQQAKRYAKKAYRTSVQTAARAVYGPSYGRIAPEQRPYVFPMERKAAEALWDYKIRHVKPLTPDQYRRAYPLDEIEEYIGCQLCGEQNVQPMYMPKGRVRGGIRWHYYVVRCPSCGHLYRNPNVRPERLGDLYADQYSTFLSGDYAAKRRRRYKLTLKAFSPWFDKGEDRRLFDFGCGIGLFLELAAKRGFETYGVDLSPDSIEQARQRPGAERTWCAKPLEVPEIARGGFDVITMWSVLAHLPRAQEDLEMLRSLLAPDGMLLIFTVNSNSLLLKRYRAGWNGFTKNHLFYYRRETLTQLAKLAGFSDIEFRPFYGDTVEAGTTKLSAEHVAELRRVVETDQGNMMRAVLFNSARKS